LLVQIKNLTRQSFAIRSRNQCGAGCIEATFTCLDSKRSELIPTIDRNAETADTDCGAKVSPMETPAQSVSTIAPTTTPAATIPLVFALAGNGTWLAYVLATVAVLPMALLAGAQRSFRGLLVVGCCWL
jgi:hypothetical protein